MMLDTRIPAVLTSALALVIAAFAPGCGSDTGGTGGGSTSTTSASSTSKSSSAVTTTSATTSTGSGLVCTGPGFGGGETLVPGGSVTAKIVDQAGAPVPNQPVFICGIDICSPPGMTGADGSVSIMTNLMMKKPAFKFGDQLAYSELAIPITGTTTTVGTVGTGKLPQGGPMLAAGADAQSGGVTISPPAGSTVSVNTLVYDTPAKEGFGAVSLPLAQEAKVLDPVMVSGMSASFKAMYAVTPVGTTFCPAAKVSVALPSDTMQPNNFGWAANAKVEFWVMTTDAAQEYAPYGGWAKISDGTVSADGKTVTTDAQSGFKYLDNFALRLAN